MKTIQHIILNTTIFVFTCSIINKSQAQNIGINSTGSNAHPSALLDLNSSPGNNTGFLITRSDTASIISPAFGLMTLRPADSCLYLFNGVSWKGLGGGGKNCKCNCYAAPQFTLQQTFSYTGTDQSFTIPLNANWLRIYAWGAGGEELSGFTTAKFNVGTSPIIAGAVLKIMVGQKSNYTAPAGSIAPVTYGFGGSGISAANEGYSGAGLSGIFTGSTVILNTDASRALVIAGGAGGVNDNQGGGGVPTAYGTVGNDPSGGGMPNFSGLNAPNNGSGGGGGGYNGGASRALYGAANPAKGGTGFYHANAISGSIQYSSPVTSPGNPPSISNPYYISPSGLGANSLTNSNGNGLVVIEWGN